MQIYKRTHVLSCNNSSFEISIISNRNKKMARCLLDLTTVTDRSVSYHYNLKTSEKSMVCKHSLLPKPVDMTLLC